MAARNSKPKLTTSSRRRRRAPQRFEVFFQNFFIFL
jgi:hypothetical protein